MRFKNKRHEAYIPSVNLIPMLDVMMTVLTFFVLISMMLTTAPKGVDVTLPKDGEGQAIQSEETLNYLLVKLKSNQQIWLGEKQLVDQGQLQAQVKAYLDSNKKGTVLLNAEPNVSYEWVIQVLAQLRAIGGDRVSLAIESE